MPQSQFRVKVKFQNGGPRRKNILEGLQRLPWLNMSMLA